MASRSWNRVELIGNLTRDPELRYTPNGAAVCTFGLATNRTYVTDGEKKEEVDFHRLVAWNKLAELCNQLLKKGTKVFISGRLQTRSWEAADGQTRTVTEIVIEDMILLSPKQVSSDAPSMDPDKIGVEDVTAVMDPDKIGVEEPVEAPKKTEPTKTEKKETLKAETPASRARLDPIESERAGTPPQEEVSADEDLPF